jgi:hypothetical protein
MSDIGEFTIVLTSTLDDIPPKATHSAATMTFKLTFIDPCLATSIHVPASLIATPFPDIHTSVKKGTYEFSSFNNFKD